MDSKNGNAFIQEIQEEYRKIDDRWLKLHHKAVAYLAFAGLLIEAVLAIVLFSLEHNNMNIQLNEYIAKYILLPILLNTCCAIASTCAMRVPRLSARTKAYIISIAMVGICFVFYSAHQNYNIYIVFSVPVLFTAIYGKYLMTTAIAAISLLSKVVSDLFIYWSATKVNPLSDGFGTIGFVLSILLLILFYAISMVIISFQKKKDRAVIQKEIERCQIQQQLITDPLTKIYNRVALREALSDMEADAPGVPYYFAMVDLDNFKQLNDTLGHEKGDQCLEEAGRILKEFCLEDAVPFRFGGDEFCAVFKNKTIDDIAGILRNIQETFRKSVLSSFDIPVTMSIGVARYTKGMTPTQILQKADMALYRSKERKDAISISEE